MKYLVLPFLVVVCTLFADAQNNDWFKGSWYGVKGFTGARIGIRVLVRIEVDSVYNNRFTGRFIYMYPKDTLARLIRTFNGSIKNKSIRLNKGKEIYLLDPRSRSFWSNCSQCDETASVALNDSDLVFKITTTNCGDSCNGETVFTRNIYSYNQVTQTKIKKLFAPPVTIYAKSKQKNTNIKTAKKSLADTTKKNQSITQSGNVSKSTTSTETVKVKSTDSISPTTTGRETNHGNTEQLTSSTVTAAITTNQKNKNIHAPSQGLADTNKDNQSVTQSGNKKTIEPTGNVSKSTTSTETLKVKSADPISPTTAAREINHGNTKQLTSSTAIAGLNTNQKNKNTHAPPQSLADTNKNNQAITQSGNKQATNTTDSLAKTGVSTEMLSIPKTEPVPQAIIQRKTDLINTFQVDSPHIRVDLFDNGEIDSDIVSVYYNGRLIINHVTLTDTAITFFIDASATNRYHEFILIAENEGSIPPNTAFLRIKAGSKQYKLTVSTSETNNAKIAIDYLGD